jgi:hypothetical protein
MVILDGGNSRFGSEYLDYCNDRTLVDAHARGTICYQLVASL